MSLQIVETTSGSESEIAYRGEAKQESNERRSTARAGVNWRDARGQEAAPTLSSLGIGDTATDWHDRFLIRSDLYMYHAVFIACGDTLQSDWEMERLGETLEDCLPVQLCDRFAEGCQRSLKEGCPVPIEGSYLDDADHKVLFRCVMMPVKANKGDVDFIYGAYSHKIAA
ncbi:MAG: hypothetical protein QF384_17200 [Alphaproteobacteria bacterium]|nr:hypothetical protein [Alphaproteobacteria bacterium]MDP6830875.1 hypothetical protein [Alphaproteobacteria bacterium]